MRPAPQRYNTVMETKRFIYCEDCGKFVGWLEEYPEYRTQGETLDELRTHLAELYKDIISGGIRCTHKVGELSLP